MSEWEAERGGLYTEIGKLRATLRSAGLQAVPPSMPPSNLAVALRDTSEEAPTGSEDVTPEAAIAAVGGAERMELLRTAAVQWVNVSLALPWRAWRCHVADAKLERLAQQASSLDGSLSSAELAASVAALSQKNEHRTRTASLARHRS